MEHGWSLDMSRWRKLKLILSHYGLEWEVCILNDKYISSIPQKAGVYMLCLPPMDCEYCFLGKNDDKKLNIFNAIYIGRSMNLRTRFGHYAKRKNISSKIKGFLQKHRHLKVTFGHAVCKGVSRAAAIKQIEGALIDCFGPSANARREDIGSTVQGQCKAPINL